jgi:glutathione synthase/RimK-type ligase-like ATP-grasp enzyme
MRIGIFGKPDDAHCRSVAQALSRAGATPVVVSGSDLHDGQDFAFENGSFFYRGECLDDVGAWQVRRLLSPLPPAFTLDDEVFLYDDWLRDYMHRRERFGYLLSWMHALAARGVPLVNPPEQGVGTQLKTFQLACAQQLGLPTPRTLVTNNPDRARAFADAVGSVVYKPSMGGDLCRPLDAEARGRLELIKTHPVIFQERGEGMSVRVTMVGGEVVSCVAVASDSLDYRADPEYRTGGQAYVELELPADLTERLVRLNTMLGLSFAGVDLIAAEDGRYVFLEANSSPSYLDIEDKTGAPISDRLAALLLRSANRRAVGPARRSASGFVRYASPFDPPAA